MSELPADELRRLAVLRDYGVLDTAPEAELDDIVALAGRICAAPMALVTLIDESRQWFKSRLGLGLAETARDHSFCQHALHGPDLLLVPDATEDARFAGNPYVVGEPNIRFYAGAALITPEGERLGTLCVLDRRRRDLDPDQQQALRLLSRHVMTHLELGRRLRARQSSERAQRELTEKLDRERRRLVEAQAVAKVGSWETDLATLGVTWSEETHRIFGTDPATFHPTHAGFLTLVHPDDRSAVDRALVASAASREPCVIEHRLLLPDGTAKVVEERWQVFFADDGRPVRAIGTCQDVTERRRLERERLQLVHNLGERVKELRALHLAADLLRRHERPLDGILAGLVALLPPALQFPERGAARLEFDGVVHTTPGWRESPWSLCSRFSSLRGRSGLLHVVYFTECPPADEGPFLAEERRLVDSVVEMLRGTIDRRDAEAVVRETQRRLTLILDSVTEGIHGLDREGRVVFQNAAGAALLGWPPEELLGSHAHSVIHPRHADGSPYPVEDCPIHRTLRDGTVRHVENEVFFRRDGTSFPVDYTCSPILDAAGAIAGAVVSFQDVSARREAEARRRDLEQRLSLTLETMSDAFFVVDRDWRFGYLNPEGERVLRRPRTELVGRILWEEFPEAVGSEFEFQYRRAVAEGRSVAFQTYFDPLAAWFDVRAHPFPLGLAVYFRDITAERTAAEALRHSEERFREMADNIGDVFFNYDPVGHRLLYANAAWESLWGRPLAEAYADPLSYLDHVHPGDRDLARLAFQRQLAGESTDIDYRLIRPDGSVRWLHEHAVPVHDSAGRLERIVGTMRDVTERRAIVDRLRESEERFRLLSKATNDAVWDWNLLTDEVWWNDGYEHLFGYRRDEVPRSIRSWTDFIHPDDLARVEAGIHRVIDHAELVDWSDEYRFRCRDGTYLPVADRGEVLRDATGRAVRMIGGMTDLTARKRTEEKLREQAALLDQAKDAILVRDLEHRILYWNRSAERFYGWSAAEAAGRSIKDLLYDDPAPFLAATAKVIRQGEWTGEIVQRRRDGSTFTVDGRWTLLRDEAGQPKSILAIYTDLTERKKLEQQFLRSQRIECIGTLAGGVAHDLNNLLAPITMGVALLRRLQTDERSARVIETIERSAQRGAELVKQVLSFGRGVDGARVSLPLRPLLQEIVAIVGSTFPKSIVADTRVPDGLWPVLGDPTQLHQILLNLCVNARDAMPSGGRLTLSAGNIAVDAPYAITHGALTPGRYVVLGVADTGIGMPKHVLDRIFDPFFTTKEAGKGTGLGLSTVLGIVRSHQGFLNVDSEPGRGTLFKVYLPAAEPAATAPQHAAAADHLPRGRGELVLLVDDEAPVREIGKRILDAFGYRVLVAEDGAQAIALFTTAPAPITVVLTDMMMPVMDGPALIVALRSIDPRIRLIASSGLTATEHVAQATRLGVKHFLAKPYTADQLLGLLRTVLDEPPPPARPAA